VIADKLQLTNYDKSQLTSESWQVTNDKWFLLIHVCSVHLQYISLSVCDKLVSFSRDKGLCTSRTLLFRPINPQNRALCASRSSQLLCSSRYLALCILWREFYQSSHHPLWKYPKKKYITPGVKLRAAKKVTILTLDHRNLFILFTIAVHGRKNPVCE
jgi:hypothetical protein